VITSNAITGDTFSRTWQLFASDGSVIDLTGCSASFGLLRLPAQTSVLNVATTDPSPSLTIPTPSNGTVMLVLTGDVTAPLPDGLYTCALKVIFNTGQKFTYAQENVNFAKEIANG
jgi:hypothetical protein